ncbi:hypothetical protein B0H67DRAFT_208231 [Lasiosphaeris hirsuta]|uniref:Uncharacterized protein n=1 Tax=Lasiosphaeris hirsuta TaxID=260670 RepID=A0AA40ARZ4_9PEZI|nr:hypothetical protein B0H67DRAFT_208231 [Lasiosphaeris hirsuta]
MGNGSKIGNHHSEHSTGTELAGLLLLELVLLIPPSVGLFPDVRQCVFAFTSLIFGQPLVLVLLTGSMAVPIHFDTKISSCMCHFGYSQITRLSLPPMSLLF